MSKLILPGLIDLHVHLRDLGQKQKEDFTTGTKAALAGGYCKIFDMPNNKTPITSFPGLTNKIKIAKTKILTDVGFYFGSVGDNLGEFKKAKKNTFGLKLYLDKTTGNFLLEKNLLSRVFSAWQACLPINKPVLLHAEEESIEDVLKVISKVKNRAHFCHISSRKELEMIIVAKERGLPVTCGVTPHHLFLNENDIKSLGNFGKMRPPLKTKRDVEFLWKNLKWIDAVESDHAPHTIREKSNPLNAPNGVPGLETTLPLLLTSVNKGRLSIEDVIRLCYEGPKKILNLKTEKDTKIEIDLSREYTIRNEDLFTKCGWSPFDGWKVKGKVTKVFLRGKKVFENGKILANSGEGKVLD